MIHTPLLGANALAGWTDTIELIQGETGSSAYYIVIFRYILAEHLDNQQTPPAEFLVLSACSDRWRTLVSSVTAASATEDWAKELGEQMAAWTLNRKRYLSWIEILAEKSEEELAPLGAAFLSAHSS